MAGLCGRNYMDNRSAITMKGNNTRLMQQSFCEKVSGLYSSCAALAAVYAKERQLGAQTVAVDMVGCTVHNLMPDVFMNYSWIKTRGGVEFTKRVEDQWRNDHAAQQALEKLTGTTRMPEICQMFRTMLTKDKVQLGCGCVHR